MKQTNLLRHLLQMLITEGVIYLVGMQNFPKNQQFSPHDTYKYVCAYWIAYYESWKGFILFA